VRLFSHKGGGLDARDPVVDLASSALRFSTKRTNFFLLTSHVLTNVSFFYVFSFFNENKYFYFFSFFNENKFIYLLKDGRSPEYAAR